MKGPPTRDDLLAYADGRLTGDEKARVEAALEQDPAIAAEVAAWRSQNETLRGLYERVSDEAVPSRLSPFRIDAAVRNERTRTWRMAAAAALLVVTGGAVGWFARDADAQGPAQGQGSLVADAVAAHDLYTREVVHPVEVKADQEQHLSTWLSKRLDRQLTVPDLQPDGLTFVGGRLLPTRSGPAAQLMYEDEGGARITLFVVASPRNAETSMRYQATGGVGSFLWADNAFECVLTGDFPREHLQQIALNAYRQFE